MADNEKMLLMAVIGKAQGLAGHLRLKNFSDLPESLAAYEFFYDKTGVVYKVEELFFHKGMPIVLLAGINDRTAAEDMAGTELYIKREQLPDSLEQDEFYQADLLAYQVYDEDGAYIGLVSGFFNFGGGDLLEIAIPAVEQSKTESGKKSNPSVKKQRPPKEKKELIPFTKTAIPTIDVQAKCVIVNRLAAGLVPYEKAEATNQV